MTQNELRALCRISIATIISSISAAAIVPAVYRARGYFDAGGEWIMIGIIFVAAYRAARRMF